MKNTTLYLSQSARKTLRGLAAARGYMAISRPGRWRCSIAEPFIAAIAAGELVVIGPVARWRDVLLALEAGANSLQVTQAQEDALWYLYNQILEDASLDDDD